MGEKAAKLVIALSRSHNALFTLIEKNVRGFGLTVSEFGVLEALLHKGDMPVQKLCEKVLVTSGSMTYIINRLEEKEYVKRYRCPKDARVWFVKLTEKGQEFISDIYPKHEQFLKEILNDVTTEDKEELIQGLFRMKDLLEQKTVK
ncbi:MarR family winged helix-turn-helix transcriptional regulator [Konateibacter massiliensis]|uniref:MarR family winged helix-turn-helix transcriptional regulator n=1 Tax=Konateibacter massiliensis TaxID=2002841 RepID=UPI000C1580CE|nr:MarR family transcriptional regulator [Konateibacter massiliensis]